LKWTIDHTTAQSREFLRSLPEHLSFNAGEKKLLIVHASVDSLNEYIYAADEERIADLLGCIEEDIYIYGHTHIPYIKKRVGKLIVNAGSVGRPKQGDTRASYALLERTPSSVQACIRKVAYNVEQTAKDIIAQGLDPYFTDFLINGGNTNPVKCDLDHSCGW
jgi:predicted phosphodiesterase